RCRTGRIRSQFRHASRSAAAGRRVLRENLGHRWRAPRRPLHMPLRSRRATMIHGFAPDSRGSRREHEALRQFRKVAGSWRWMIDPRYQSACRVSRRAGVQEYFRYPRHQDENEYENVIAFQAPPDGFQFADLEARQNQIFANELFPFTVEHLAIFHYHGDKKMRFEHSNTRAKGIIETVTTRFDP